MGEWKKVRIGKIFHLEKGCLQSSKCIQGKYDFITAAKDWKTHNTYTHDCEAIVYAVAASGSLGQAHYINGKFIASDLCLILTEKDKAKYPINFLFYQIVFESLRDEVVSKTKTGTSKEAISQKNFSAYEIPYFSIDFQNANYQRLINAKKIIAEINKEIEAQKLYVKLIRRNILQDAIEGKLTADWRKDHPVQKGNPDYDAEALFELIQKERKVDKKRKALPPIFDAEKPFELPTGWKWVRLGDVSDNIEAGKSILCKEVVPCGDEAGIVKTGVCSYGCFKEDESKTCLSEKDWRDEYAIHVDDFLIGRANTLELVGSCVIVDKLKKRLMLSDKILRINFYKQFKNQLLLHFMRTKFLRSQIEKTATGSSPTMKNISQSSINNYILPLLPLAEQEQIVDIVSGIFDIVSKIEQQILRREEYANQLMKNIVKDALEGR